MAITEETRNDLYEGLTEALGKQRATTLMEHLPPGGWGNVATKQDLQLLRTELQAQISGVRAELQGEIGGLRAEMRVGFAELRTELHKTLRMHMFAMLAVMLTAIGIVSRLPA